MFKNNKSDQTMINWSIINEEKKASIRSNLAKGKHTRDTFRSDKTAQKQHGSTFREHNLTDGTTLSKVKEKLKNLF